MRALGAGARALALLVLVAAGGCSGLQFRMFAGSSPIAEECVGEVVSWQQWDVVMGTVERNFKHHTNRNVTEAEIQQRLRDFKRPLKFELGFVTMSPNPKDETPKPVKYQIRGPEGEVVYGGPPQPVTQVGALPPSWGSAANAHKRPFPTARRGEGLLTRSSLLPFLLQGRAQQGGLCGRQGPLLRLFSVRTQPGHR